MFALAAAAMALVVYLRRVQRREHISEKREAWDAQCSRTDPEESILVLVCARRDADLLPTLDALFERAWCPQRVRVGVVTSEGSRDTVATLFPSGDGQREEWPHLSLFVHQVRIFGEPSSQGPSPARASALAALRGRERYVLFLHARATVRSRWDARLVSSLGLVGERAALTSLLVEEGAAEASSHSVIAVADVDEDGFPVLKPQPLVRMSHPRRSLFASPTLLALRGADLPSDWEHCVGSSAFAYLRRDLDAFALTLALRLRGFELFAPSSPLTEPLLRLRAEPPASDKYYRTRVARHALQASLSAALADARLSEVAEADGLVLAALEALPWVRATLGTSFLLPGLRAALEAAYDRGDPDAPGHQALLAVAQRSVLNAQELEKNGTKAHIARVVEASAIVRDHHLEPDDSRWELVLCALADANRACVLEWAGTTACAMPEVLMFLGVDVRKRSLAGRAVLGLPPGAISREEILDRFGTEEEYHRQRARWVLA